MAEPASFHGPLDSGRRRRSVAALVAVVLVVLVAVGIAKLWQPASTPASTGGASGAPGTSLGPIVTAPVPTPIGSVPSSLEPDAAFAIPAPPSLNAAWVGLRWHRLGQNEPVTYVQSVTRWKGGYVAVGWDGHGAVTKTPVWTSRDGSTWEPVKFNTSTTFRPGTVIVGLAERPGGLIAWTAQDASDACSGVASCPGNVSLVTTWTSSDGRTWTPRATTDLEPSTGALAEPRFVAGLGGVVAAWSEFGGTGPAVSRIAHSADGIAWTGLPAGALPAGFALADLRSFGPGFIAGGRIEGADGQSAAAAVWSTDGRNWTQGPPMPEASLVRLVDTRGPHAEIVSLLAGSDGLIAVGRRIETPGATLWWHSSDGKRWAVMSGFPPLGPTSCIGEGCGSDPDGIIVGDGQRLVALRGGARPGFWTSADGVTWIAGSWTGDGPFAALADPVMLPGGVLVQDANGMWYGEAITN